MGRTAVQEAEWVEGLRDLDDRAELEAVLDRVEADEDSAAARGLALAILVSTVIWIVIVGLIALAVS